MLWFKSILFFKKKGLELTGTIGMTLAPYGSRLPLQSPEFLVYWEGLLAETQEGSRSQGEAQV